MSNKNQELCEKLIKAESESEVISILKKAGYWDDLSVWRNYGDNAMNFSQIGNQQSLPEAALVEKIINSVDALLIRECKLRGMNPEDSSVVPLTIQEATELFFGVKRGDLSKLITSDRTKLAENISLIATGKKSKPNYTIIDLGEGQTPNMFSETLVSLSKQNKVKIPFVQGKFNMGSTGVLQFCGKDNLQLIISKKHPEIAKNLNDSDKNQWGFTVVRRVRPEGSMKSSVYKYLAPNNEVLRFSVNGLPVLPGDYPIAYETDLEWGTVIKLYEYALPGALKTNILFDLNYRLSVLMPEVALPIRIYERRKGYRGHSLEATLPGLVVRLKQDRSEKLEVGFPNSASITVRGQKMPCEIYAFKKDAIRRGIKSEGILYSVNGQTHGTTHQRFYTRTKVGMNYLADSILTIVDCSKISKDVIEDLFMNSRDRLRDVELKSEIEKELEKVIHDHPGLKQLRERRRRERLSDRLGESKPLKDVLDKVLKKSSTLAQLLKHGKLLHTPFNLTGVDVEEEFKGNYYPDFFNLRSKDYKKCPINHRFKMMYNTDAMNDYFSRTEFPGDFELCLNGNEYEDYSISLWNGTGTLTVELPSDISLGEELSFSTEVSDETGFNRFTSDFIIKVLPKAEVEYPPGGKRASGSGSKGEKKKKPLQLQIPNVERVYTDKWEQHDFDKSSALRVYHADEKEYDFFVNMDNEWLLSEIKSRFKEEPEIFKAQFEFGMALVGIGMLMDGHTNEVSSSEEPDVLEMIPRVTRAIAPIMLPLINELGTMIDDEVEIEG